MLLSLKRKNKLTVGVLSIMAVPLALFIIFRPVSSLQITNRSVTISSAVPGDTVSNAFVFDIASATNIGSIAFEYCTNSPIQEIACVAPTGLDVLGATLSAQSLNTGFTEDIPNSTAERLVLTRVAVPAVPGSSSYTIDDIVNPSTLNETTYIRIATYASTDGTGPITDGGTVAFSTAQPNFNVGLFVPPYLTFCTGLTVATDCSSTSGGLVSFGEFSSASTVSATTQMAAATNDFTGYNIFLTGQTLTSGNNTIAPLLSQTASSTGVAQFGLNLRQNSSPSVGADPNGVGSGVPATSYNTQNQFMFGNGDIVALSPVSSDFTRFTASYIANVPDGQSPGVYATTLTYMAVVSF